MFRQIAPLELPDVWSFVEPGLLDIIEKCGGSLEVEWTARDIRRRLHENAATLFIYSTTAIEASKPQAADELLSGALGFVVLERAVMSFSLEPYLNVWLMWFQPSKAMPLKDEIFAWLCQMRRQVRVEKWRFSSPRYAWGWLMEPMCRRVMQTWECDK